MTLNVVCKQVFPTIVVRDIAAAIDFYVNRLGFSHQFSWGEPVSFAGVALDQAELYLQQDFAFGKGISEVSFILENVDEVYQFHLGNEVEVLVPLDDRSYGIRDYKIKDIDGNYLNFGSDISAK